MRVLSCHLGSPLRRSVPEHAHATIEWHCLVAGRCGFAFGRELRRLRPGDFFAVRPGQRHGLRIEGGGDWALQYVVQSEPADERDRALMAAWWRRQEPIVRLGERDQAFFAQLESIVASGDRWRREGAELRFTALLCELVAGRGASDAATPAGVARALAIIQARVRQRLTLDELVAATGLDRAYLVRSFSRHVGTPPLRYHMRLKLELAAQLLRQGDVPVQELARQVGFDDPFHFSRRFKAWSGVSPSAYRAG